MSSETGRWPFATRPLPRPPRPGLRPNIVQSCNPSSGIMSSSHYGATMILGIVRATEHATVTALSSGFGACTCSCALHVSKQRRAHAQCFERMYDFCFTFPYSLLLAFGGLIGFVTKGSVPSLLGGVGSAALLAACGYVSLQRYHQGRLCRYACH